MVSEFLADHQEGKLKRVLILVVVEDGLRVCEEIHSKDAQGCVLILVVVEDGLREQG